MVVSVWASSALSRSAPGGAAGCEAAVVAAGGVEESSSLAHPAAAEAVRLPRALAMKPEWAQ
jgi:hypothetical protein